MGGDVARVGDMRTLREETTRKT